MTVLQVVKDVCAVVAVKTPSSLFASINSNRTMEEMLACANEMAQRIAGDYREWRRLKTSVTYTGDGTATAFNLPANYKRMLLTSNVWRSTSATAPMKFIADDDDWDQHRAMGYNDAKGEWRLYGDQIQIEPAMGVGIIARFNYLDKNCVTLASGGFGDRFMQDTDSFRLDERLLKLGMIWQWRAQKGAPYAEDMGTYTDAMSVAFATDKPAPIIIDTVPISHTAKVGMVWPPGWGPQP